MTSKDENTKKCTGVKLVKNKRKKYRMCVMILLVILLLGIGVIVALCVKKSRSDDFAPKVDQAAEQMESSGEKLDEPKGGGAVSLTYSTVVTVSTEDRTVRILFENPSKSTKDTSLQLTVNGQNEGEELLIAESELIPAGYKLAQMNLKDKVDLDPGKYEGNLKVLYYDSENGEKEVVDTKIPVTLAVNNGNKI